MPGAMIALLLSGGVQLAAANANITNQVATRDFGTSITACYYESDFGTTSGWNRSGVDSGPEWFFDSSSPDDVDIARTTGSLQIIVRPATGRTRIAGWNNPNVLSGVDANSFVRAKFYISSSNPAWAPVNEVPNFRLRLSQGSSVLSETNFQHAATGTGGVSYEPLYDTFNEPERETSAGQYLQPSRNASLPSLYRIDYDPVDVNGATTEPVAALFESYSSQNPADGVLSLHEIVVCTYPKLDDTSGTKIFEYDRRNGLYAGAGGTKVFTHGAFNTEADFQAGRMPDLYLSPSSDMTSMSETSGGIILDTANVPDTVFGNGLAHLNSASYSDRPRIQPGKIYKARFYATSALPTYSTNTETIRQSGISFRLQSAHSAVSAYTRVVGPINAGAGNANFVKRVLPGIGCENPETSASLDVAGEAGGWYSVVMSSPLDADIRPDTSGSLGLLSSEPGPNVNLPSSKDIVIGVDVQHCPRDLRLSPSYVGTNFYNANDANVRISRIELYEYDQIDDGGY